MKVLLILWAIGLTACEKLDRTYLPPPGSITAGGRPGDLDLPLEFPKQNYPSTLEPTGDDTVISGSLRPKFPNVAFGIDRQGPPVTSAESFTTRPGVSFSKNTFKVPTSTLNALTQTTPLPTLKNSGAIGSVSTHGYPSKTVSIGSNLEYPQQTDTVFTYSPGSAQYSTNDGEKSMGNPHSTHFQNNRKFGGQVPRIDETTLASQDFSNSTQYGDHFDNISGITNPTAESSYTDEYYDEPTSVSATPNFGQVDVKNQQYPGREENFNDKNMYQDIYSPVNTLLPNQYSEKSSSPISDDMSSHNYGSTPTYSSTIDNLRPRYDIRTHPERIQADNDRRAVIVNYKNILTPEGFAYSFDTSNGIHADESGTAIDGVKAEGSYSYTGDDGKVYSVVYTADENGFVPRGAHLPTAPPIPEAILKVIEQATINKQLGIIDDGSYDEAKYGHGKYQGSLNRIPQIQLGNNIRKLQNNKGDNLSGRQEENIPINMGKDLAQVYDGDENQRQYSEKKSYSSDDGTHFLLDSDQINNNGLLTSGRIQDINIPVFRGSQEQSTDNSELSNEKSVPFLPDYTTDSQQTDKILPEMANKNNQNNVGLFKTQTYDDFPSTTQLTIIRKGYGQDINQPSNTGYEYNHPQNAFSDDNENNLKSGFSKTNKQNDKTELEDKVYNKGKTPKPFITPNVSFNFNSRKTDEAIVKRPLGQNGNRPVTTAEDRSSYTPSANNDFNQRGTSTDNNNASDYDDNGNMGVNNRDFSTRKPYGSTSSSTQNYESPYTSKVNGGQRYDSQTPTLRSQYDSTTPLPSEISSRLTPSTIRRYYSQTTPSQYTTTFRPSISSEQYGTTSRRPSNTERINGVKIPTTGPDSYVSRGTGYRGDPGTSNDDTGYMQAQTGFQDEFRPGFESSSRPDKFGSHSSREGVIGEDFSGPKQSQRYEPGHGYYY